MSPAVRRAALTVHVIASVGWIGAAAGFLVLAVHGLRSDSAASFRAVYPALEVITRAAIVPLAVVATLSGVVQGLGTPWGLLRHYWVVVKLVITTAALVILLLQAAPIAELADEAMRDSATRHGTKSARTSLVVHSAGGIAVLLVPTVLSIYKPKGLTRRGRRYAAARSAVR